MKLSELRIGDVGQFVSSGWKFIVRVRSPEDRCLDSSRITLESGASLDYFWDRENPEVVKLGRGRMVVSTPPFTLDFPDKSGTQDSGKPGRLEVGASYLDLIQLFPLRPIHTEEGLDLALEVIDILMDRDTISPDEQDYLDVLGDITEKYEREHYPRPPLSDTEVLRHLIESHKVTQVQVADETGIAESTISAYANGRRKVTRKHVEILADYFRVDPTVFLTRG